MMDVRFELRPTIVVPEIRKSNRISLHRTETREQSRRYVVMGHFCSLPTQEKTCFSHIALHRCRDSSPYKTRIASKNLESVCSTELRVLAAQFEGRRWPVSRGLAY